MNRRLDDAAEQALTDAEAAAREGRKAVEVIRDRASRLIYSSRRRGEVQTSAVLEILLKDLGGIDKHFTNVLSKLEDVG